MTSTTPTVGRNAASSSPTTHDAHAAEPQKVDAVNAASVISDRAAAPPSELVTFRIDGRPVHAPKGTYVLQAAREAGIRIPTLCHHPDLTPEGMCRLCLVEITYPDWNGSTDLVTSCLYPVAQGLEVFTGSPRVRTARAGVMQLLLARCPNSAELRALAEEYGGTQEGFVSDPNADNCILCGLCTRVCNTYSTSAIGTVSRGIDKQIASFEQFEHSAHCAHNELVGHNTAHRDTSSDCVGCGGCEIVCPTNACRGERTSTGYRIWGRHFPAHVCTVNPAQCVGCASCEDACPFAAVRVRWRMGQEPCAVIAPQHCRGCGACIGACPTGAITQSIDSIESIDSSDQAANTDTRRDGSEPEDHPSADACYVFACARSRPGSWKTSAHVREVPCVGTVTPAALLRLIVSGTSAVLVLGRHQTTCRLNGAEKAAVSAVSQARELLRVAGVDAVRVQFRDPAPGRNGPAKQVEEFTHSAASLPKASPVHIALAQRDGIDASLELFETLLSRNHSEQQLGPWLQQRRLTSGNDADAVLFADMIAPLAILGRDLFAPLRMEGLLHAARQVLHKLGIGQPQRIAVRAMTSNIANNLPAFGWRKSQPLNGRITALDDLLQRRGSELIMHGKQVLSHNLRVAVDATNDQRELVQALGFEPVCVEATNSSQGLSMTDNADRLAMDSQQRGAMLLRLANAERAGARVLLVNNPMSLARWSLLTRHGAWQTGRLLPMLGVQLAWLRMRMNDKLDEDPEPRRTAPVSHDEQRDEIDHVKQATVQQLITDAARGQVEPHEDAARCSEQVTS